MKKSSRYTALALVALTSALLLGACGGNKQATTTSSTTKTSQSSKMTKSSTKAKAKSENKSKSSSYEEMKADSSASQEGQPTKQAEAIKEEKATSSAESKQDSSFDTDALLKGDFSSVAGTYQNDLGETITVSASGSVTLVKDGTSDTSSQLHNGRVQGDGYVATFAHNDGPGSDPIFFDSNGQIRFGSAVDYGAMHAFSKVN